MTGLFTYIETPRARRSDPDTSHAAAHRVWAGKQHRRIMAILIAYPGQNHAEIDEIAGWTAGTTAKRLTELRRAGLIVRGKKTATPTGHCEAYTYTATDAGVAWAREHTDE